MLNNSSLLAAIVSFFINAFIDLHILKHFLKTPFKATIWRYIKMICIGAVLSLPLFIFILLLSWYISPELLNTFEAMDHLFSVQGLSMILSGGLSAHQLRWGIIILCERLTSLYVTYFFYCFAYQHYVDSSVDKSQLKKAVLAMTLCSYFINVILNIIKPLWI